MISTFRVTRTRIAIALALTLTALVATLANQTLFNDANADSHKGANEVRVSARALEDGRVEVALRQLDGGVPGERILPDARFLRADAQAGTWFDSSDVALAAIADSMMSDDSVPATAASEPIGTACLISHGRADDFFWVLLSGRAAGFSRALNLDLDIQHHADPADQAAAVRQCAADGVDAIAATLAAPDMVAPALKEAADMGILVQTFNSGYEFANDAGSSLHIALDEAAAGRIGGEAFDQLEVDGTVLCVIHEEDNDALHTRCDALTESYSGSVEVVQLDETLDLAGATAAIGAALTNQVGGVFALNGDTATAALLAIDAAESDALVGSVDMNLLQLVTREEALLDSFAFAISGNAQLQALVTVAWLADQLLLRAQGANTLTGDVATITLSEPTIVIGIGEQLKNPALRKWILSRLGGN